MANTSKNEMDDEFLITLPEPYLTAIGKVCVQWGLLEVAVEMATYKLAGMDSNDWRSKVMVTHMAWPQRVDILASLTEDLLENYPHLKNYKLKVRPALKKAQKGRNRIVHAQWDYDEDTGVASILSASARGKLKLAITPTTIDEIESIADNVGRANIFVWKMILNKL